MMKIQIITQLMRNNTPSHIIYIEGCGLNASGRDRVATVPCFQQVLFWILMNEFQKNSFYFRGNVYDLRSKTISLSPLNHAIWASKTTTSPLAPIIICFLTSAYTRIMNPWFRNTLLTTPCLLCLILKESTLSPMTHPK